MRIKRLSILIALFMTTSVVAFEYVNNPQTGQPDIIGLFSDMPTICEGPQGFRGYSGARGPQGFRGYSGARGLQGFRGYSGARGLTGQGVPPGGTIGQQLRKKSNADFDTEWIVPTDTTLWGTIVGTISAQTDLMATFEAKNSNIQTHISSTSNPHSTTYTQVGADAAGAAAAAQAASEPRNSNIQAHIGSTTNPHATTADQVLPTQAGNAGKVLGTNGSTSSWVAGGSGTPGGSNRQLQYNNNGAFAGAAFARYSAYTGGGALIITGQMVIK